MVNINVNFQNLQMEIESITTVDEHLQLAAELGKTLLERNQELETLLKKHQHTIEEQEQEIVYLKKNITALRASNDSRLKVYEQLEVGIQDLESANQRLLAENTADKKHIKTLGHNIETLETRCEELTKKLEEYRQSLTVEKRKNERLAGEMSKAADFTQSGYEANTTAPENCSFAFVSPGSHHNANSTAISGVDGESSFDFSMLYGQEDNNEIIKLVSNLEATKRGFMAEQQRCSELEEQLVAIIQENQSLQSRIAQNSATEEIKSIHDELSALDEVRQGQICSSCLRPIDDRLAVNDEESFLASTEECEKDNERTLLDLDGQRHAGMDDNVSEHSQAAYCTKVVKVVPQDLDSLHLNIPSSPNHYCDLFEKYEPLLEAQQCSIERKTNHNGVEADNNNGGRAMSLAEEFQLSGEFRQTKNLMFQSASNNGDNDLQNKIKTSDKNFGYTPIEFSEAETYSSGYSNEKSNKATQTDERPSYFMCSIGDDDVQSVISSAVSDENYAVSKCIIKLKHKNAKKHFIEKNLENKSPRTQSIVQLKSPSDKQIINNDRVLTHLQREQLDYLTVSVGIKKNKRLKNRDGSESVLSLCIPPRTSVGSSRRRKDGTPYIESPIGELYNTPNSTKGSRSVAKYVWNNSSMVIYHRSLNEHSSSSASQDVEDGSVRYEPSTVSQDLLKLKELDLSYAEVLRRNDIPKQHHYTQ